MSREVTITASQLSQESDQALQLLALGVLYVSGFSIVVEAGPPTPLWLLLDSAFVTAAYLEKHKAQLPAMWRCLVPQSVWGHVALSAVTTVAAIGLSLTFPNQAHAFAQTLEQNIGQCFPQAQEGIKIIFGLLRLGLSIFLLSQMVSSVVQIGRGESPLPLLIPALAVIAAVVIVDFMATFIGGC
ncbi:MAG: hypothetical protein AAF821_00150 [Cyanobacteria bacterium P01_D01_bin.156]